MHFFLAVAKLFSLLLSFLEARGKHQVLSQRLELHRQKQELYNSRRQQKENEKTWLNHDNVVVVSSLEGVCWHQKFFR